MRLNPLLMEKLAGEEEYAAGRDLDEAGAVRIAEEDRGMIRYTVADEHLQAVTLTRKLVVHCGCDVFLRRGCCRHAVAAWLAADRSGVPEQMMKKQAPETAGELTELILREMPAEANIRLEATLVLPQKGGRQVILQGADDGPRSIPSDLPRGRRLTETHGARIRIQLHDDVLHAVHGAQRGLEGRPQRDGHPAPLDPGDPHSCLLSVSKICSILRPMP